MNDNAIKVTVLLIHCFVLLIACNKNSRDGFLNNDNNEPEPPVPSVLQITPIGELNQGNATVNSHAGFISRSSLKMDFRSYIGLGESSLGVPNPYYPRIKKMANGDYIAFFHNNKTGARCNYALSPDLKTWTPKGELFKNYSIIDSDGMKNERSFSNCDALVLSDGDVIAVASYRATTGYREKPLDAGVILRRSKDNGVTWEDPVEIYQGVNWEPYLLQLPSGRIQCYFTDAGRTLIEGTDTGTDMIISDDNGNTWSPSFGNAPYYVLRTKHMINGKTYFTNQMPSVIMLNNSNELAAALEAHPDHYYISFAYSGDDGEWPHLAVDEDGPEDRNDNAFYGTGPYLVQFKSGETVLSYNTGSIFNMKIGDARARSFGEAYTPYAATGYSPAMEIINSHELIAFTPDPSRQAIMLAKFILNHNITATKRSVKVDGDNSEWKNTDEALFVGENSQAQATLRASADNENIYFLAEVSDDYISENDYATIFLSPVTSDNTLANGAYRIKVAYNGIRNFHVYNNGWIAGNSVAEVKSSYRGTISNNNDVDHGYIVEFSIPRAKLNIQSGQILVNFSIADSGNSEDAIFDTASANTAKWISIMGL